MGPRGAEGRCQAGSPAAAQLRPLESDWRWTLIAGHGADGGLTWDIGSPEDGESAFLDFT